MTHPAGAAISALMEQYRAAWAANDPAALKACWDADAAPLYLAEEVDETLADWAAVERYWSMNEGLHADVALSFSDPAFTELAQGVVMAAWRMDWAIAFTEKPAMAGWNRVAAVYREIDAGWRLTAWIEAPLAAITYIRKLYEERAGG